MAGVCCSQTTPSRQVGITASYSSCHTGILDWLRPTSQNPDGARLRGVLGIDTKTTRLNESRNGQEQFQDRRPRGPSFFTPLSSGGNIEALGITSGRVLYWWWLNVAQPTLLVAAFLHICAPRANSPSSIPVWESFG